MNAEFIFRLRNRLIRLTSGEASPLKSFLFRNSIFLVLLLCIVPWKVAREIAHGRDGKVTNLKDSLRITMWLWNRSWVPVKQPLHTFFDIGWILSDTSCEVLLSKGFVRRDHPFNQCDRAQYKLSAIRAGYEEGNNEKLLSADREITSLVSAVFAHASTWLMETGMQGEPDASPAPSDNPETRAVAGDFDNAETRAALLLFHDLCRQIGQDYYLISGTFLGIVRDGAFIGNDHDIDAGIDEHALSEDLVPSLEKHPDFEIRKVDRILRRRENNGAVQYELMESPAIIQFVHRSGVLFDLFIHFKEAGVTWHGDSMHRWDNSNFDLSGYEFLGREFRAPSDPDRYLTENYGPDWRTPKSDFDSMVDTPNMTFVGSPNGLVFWAWMVTDAVTSKDAQRLRSYLDLLKCQGVWPSD